MKTVPFKKLNEEAKVEMIANLKEMIGRVERDELIMYAAVTLDNNDDIAAYHSRLQRASGLEVIGLVEMLRDYLKDTFYGE
jgi:putative SOS response-associated peptidase YedK